MRLLAVLALLGAAAFVAWRLTKGPVDDSPRSRRLAELAVAVLTLVMVAAAVYVAHLLGIFSVPLVALLFVPFGLAIRWLLVATRDSRRRGELDRAAAGGGPWARLVLPTLVALAVAVAVLGVIVGGLVGPH